MCTSHTKSSSVSEIVEGRSVARLRLPHILFVILLLVAECHVDVHALLSDLLIL